MKHKETTRETPRSWDFGRFLLAAVREAKARNLTLIRGASLGKRGGRIEYGHEARGTGKTQSVQKSLSLGSIKMIRGGDSVKIRMPLARGPK